MLGTVFRVRLELELDSIYGFLLDCAGDYCLKSIEDITYGGKLRYVFSFF